MRFSIWVSVRRGAASRVFALSRTRFGGPFASSKDIAMTMTTSAKGRLELVSHEAIVLCPYRDSVGVWTWGVGHASDGLDPHPASMPKGVASPIPDILAVFSKDLAKFEDRVRKA